MSSFANIKKKSRASFQALQEKLNQQNKSGYKDEREFYPALDENGNGFAIIRFLQVGDGEKLPIVKTYKHSFRGPTNQWFIEECPTTIGEKCPVCEANSKLWNTGIEANRKLASARKRRVQYHSNIYVVQDSKNPEREGQVMLFTYGRKIYQKIEQAWTPEFEDEVPFNPFDLWEGANFKLKIRKVDNITNYDSSSWEPISPLAPTDEEIEAIWKKQYDLQEFLDPSRFKSYEELAARLDVVLGLSEASTAVPSAAALAAKTAESAQPKVAAAKETAPSGEETPPWAANNEAADAATSSAASNNDDEDDEALALLRKLAYESQ